jgi:hypothetical protein
VNLNNFCCSLSLEQLAGSEREGYFAVCRLCVRRRRSKFVSGHKLPWRVWASSTAISCRVRMVGFVRRRKVPGRTERERALSAAVTHFIVCALGRKNSGFPHAGPACARALLPATLARNWK